MRGLAMLYSQIMHYCGSLCVSAVLSDSVDKIKTVSDRTVWVGPAGDTVLMHFQQVIVLEGHKKKNISYDNEQACTNIGFMHCSMCEPYLWRLHCEVLYQKSVIIGQTYVLLPRVRHSETIKAHWLIFTGPKNTTLPFNTLRRIEKVSMIEYNHHMYCMNYKERVCVCVT